MPQPHTKESVSINIRAKAKQRDLIHQAATCLGRSRSEFMLEAACREAENILLDQAFSPSMRAHLPNSRPCLTNHCHPRINYAAGSKPKRLRKNDKTKSQAAFTDHINLSAFDSSEPSLNKWLKKRALKNQAAGASCFA